MTATGTHRPELPRATAQDGTHPRPQLLRARWRDLGGPWDFAVDDADAGLDAHWYHPSPTPTTPSPSELSGAERSGVRVGTDSSAGVGGPGVGPDAFDRTITVPFPPESPASGVGLTDLHVVWYRRLLTDEDLAAAGLGDQGDRLLVHLAAVDHRADVWLAGHHLGRHEGGQTPFALDATAAVARARADGVPLALVVRAEDDRLDVAQPRGKQDWRPDPHSIWYHRTTGIWQPVWLEAVPALHLEDVAWQTDVPDGSVLLTARLSRRPRDPATVAVRLELGDEVLADVTTLVLDRDVRVRLDLARQANGQQYEELLWSPERPTLLDAVVALREGEAPGGPVVDAVGSYLGVRSVAVGDGHLWLNDRPLRLRSVLEQGYWPDTHLAAPSADALRAEVQLIKDLGFNSARVHQKAEDPRFLFWADRLGLTVWAETANAYAYSPRSVELLTREWLELVRRDRSHPCVVTWVPLNESWGVQHGSHDVRQQHYGLALAHLTRALDPTRPVVSNDGWEHTDSDIWTIHDYAERGDELRVRYGTPEAVRALLDGVGPAGRRLRLRDAAPVVDRGQPVMLTEFGGVSWAGGRDDAWGYSTASSAEDFAARVGDLLAAAREAQPLAGFCWTQLTDTGQETNGLLHADRRPKLPVEQLRRLVTGEP